MASKQIPNPIFDTLEVTINQYKELHNSPNPHGFIKEQVKHCFIGDFPEYAIKDYQTVLSFLYTYRGSSDTFVAYRRDLERLLQWSWFIRNQSILQHKRDDIEAFVEFCLKPYKSWIGLKKVARFKYHNGEKIPNLEWRPFEAHISKKDFKSGKTPNRDDFQFSQQALKVMFGILSSFYNYLIQEEITESNPILLIRQKSKFIRKETIHTIRRLSNTQWQTVINFAKNKALNDPKHERTVFILSCLYGMYLRISELAATARWTPTMNNFFKDNDGNWWFKTVSKGNKARQIAVSPAMLNALSHYRANYLNLTPYPTPDENIPLISHVDNRNKSITSTRPIRKLVQECFDQAADELEKNGDQYEANLLRVATVHWLRHTGISEDVKIRPREHVRDDAGHSSGAITDRYIDVELAARAKSAHNKVIDSENR